MKIPRPAAVGQRYVVDQLRSVLFSEPILGAASAHPKGYMKLLFAPLLGWWAPLLARRATEPLPPTPIYVAVTPVDIRLFSKPGFGEPFELGRWTKGSYRASTGESWRSLRLDLELERIGRVRLYAPHDARPVLELIVLGAKT